MQSHYKEIICYFCIFYNIFLIKKKYLFFVVSLYNGLVEYLQVSLTLETNLMYLVILENLLEVFGCSLVTDFMSIVPEFSKGFGC